MITHALGYQTKLPPKAIRETDLYAELKLTEIFLRPSTTGIWYDPQDLTTMYQDAQGTLPVYRPGTGLVDPPVGLMLDKSQGLELGPELWEGTLTAGTGGVFNAATGELSCVSTTGVTHYPQFGGPELTAKTFYKIAVKFSGNLSKIRSVTCTSGSSTPFFDTGGVAKETILAAGGEYSWIGGRFSTGDRPRFVIWTDGTTTWDGLFIESISIREIKGYHAYQSTTTARPTLSGRYNLLDATETLSTQSVTTEDTDYTLSLSGTGTVTLSGTATGTYPEGTHTITCTEGTLTLTVDGSVTKADLRASNDGVGLPPYQRVDSATTYDTAGFPLYLKFDGVDDFLQTANVDLTGTDKITVGTGLRKLSDATIQAVVSYGDYTPGRFEFLTPSAGGGNNTSFSTWPVGGANGYVTFSDASVSAPVTLTQVGRGDHSKASIEAGRFSLNIDGVQVVPTGSSAGTGSGPFGNWPLSVGARTGTTYRFNGRIYSLCIIGSLLSTSEQAVLERYLNAKTRAY